MVVLCLLGLVYGPAFFFVADGVIVDGEATAGPVTDRHNITI